MKKFLWLVLVFVLVGCSSHANEIAYLEERVADLEIERYQLIGSVVDLQATIAQMEGLGHAGGVTRDEILVSFIDNLDSVAAFLGLDELEVAEEDIVLHGDIVTAHFPVNILNQHRGRLIFRYWVWGEEIRWRLLEYEMGAASGPGFLHSGRYWWRSYRPFDQNFAVRFALLNDSLDFDVLEYIEEEIEYEDWQAQVTAHMQAHTGIQLADLWYEENRLVVDLTPAASISFNFGSTAGIMRTVSLIASLSTLPNVEEIEVLVGGQRGVYDNHFSFAGVFRVNGPQTTRS